MEALLFLMQCLRNCQLVGANTSGLICNSVKLQKTCVLQTICEIKFLPVQQEYKIAMSCTTSNT